MGMVLNHRQPRELRMMQPKIPLVQDGKPVKRYDPETRKEEQVMQNVPPVKLFPGISFLTDDEFARIENNPLYLVRVEDGIIEEVCEADVIDEVPTARGIRKMVLQATVNLDLLRKYQQAESLTAEETEIIETQILKLTDPVGFMKRQDTKRVADTMGETKRRYRTVNDVTKEKAKSKRKETKLTPVEW